MMRASIRIFFGLLVLFLALPSPAVALSPGCTGFNSTGTRNPGDNSTGFVDFLPGERVTVQVTAPAGPATYTFNLGPATLNFAIPAGGGAATQHIDTTTTGFIGFSESAGIANPAPLIVTFSCGAAPASPQPSGTSSSLLDQTRKRFSQLAARTSIENTSESVTDALDDAFNGTSVTRARNGRVAMGFAGFGGASESSPDSARPAYLGFAHGPVAAPSPWHIWLDARYTSHDDDDTALDSRHVNATGGISYRFGETVAGVVLGHEDFGYELGIRNAALDGQGWNGGGYFGWRFLDGLRLDGMLTYGQISYDARADTVTGDFDADRITGMLRLRGRWDAGTWYLEPSGRLIHAWEDQDAFIDAAGASHSAYSFDVGVASFGAEVGIPYISPTRTITPILGVFGDYRFGDDSISTVATLPELDNGWAARLSSGLRWNSSNGLSASIGGDYGGLGQDIQFWRIRGSLSAKF